MTSQDDMDSNKERHIGDLTFASACRSSSYFFHRVNADTMRAATCEAAQAGNSAGRTRKVSCPLGAGAREGADEPVIRHCK